MSVKTRGFASMDKERQRALASKGGKSAHRTRRAHEFTHDQAVAAGRKSAEGRRLRSLAAGVGSPALEVTPVPEIAPSLFRRLLTRLGY